MLEVFFLIFLSRKIGEICENKGRKGTIFKVMLVALWIGGELFGFILGAILTGGAGAILYLFAIVGAAIGAGITFLVVSSLSPVQDAHNMMPPPPSEYNSLGLNNINSQNQPPEKDINYR